MPFKGRDISYNSKIELQINLTKVSCSQSISMQLSLRVDCLVAKLEVYLQLAIVEV